MNDLRDLMPSARVTEFHFSFRSVLWFALQLFAASLIIGVGVAIIVVPLWAMWHFG